MALRDLEAQRNAQPCAALFPAGCLVRPVKRFADVRQRLRVHAVAPAPCTVSAQAARLPPCAKAHTAARPACLYSIVRQVHHQAFQERPEAGCRGVRLPTVPAPRPGQRLWVVMVRAAFSSRAGTSTGSLLPVRPAGPPFAKGARSSRQGGLPPPRCTAQPRIFPPLGQLGPLDGIQHSRPQP